MEMMMCSSQLPEKVGLGVVGSGKPKILMAVVEITTCFSVNEYYPGWSIHQWRDLVHSSGLISRPYVSVNDGVRSLQENSPADRNKELALVSIGKDGESWCFLIYVAIHEYILRDPVVLYTETVGTIVFCNAKGA